MGTMAREIDSLRGGKAAKRRKAAQDSIIEAQTNARIALEKQEEEKELFKYLHQLYFGIDQILNIVAEQDDQIKSLNNVMKEMMKSKETLVHSVQETAHEVAQPAVVREEEKALVTRTNRKAVKKDRNLLTLGKAFNLIEKYKSEHGRILWSQAPNPKKLVFAYMKKAELQGLDITSTMAMQSIPEYRRVFQYVVYNIGAWKDIVSEYQESQAEEVAV